MASIVIKFKDGTEAVFKHEGRSGGSYTKTLRHEGSFAIVKDEWDREYSFPSETIKEIQKLPNSF